MKRFILAAAVVALSTGVGCDAPTPISSATPGAPPPPIVRIMMPANVDDVFRIEDGPYFIYVAEGHGGLVVVPKDPAMWGQRPAVPAEAK